MNSFKPKKEIKEVFPFYIPEKLSKRLNKAVELSGLTKQDLVRQMVAYCLDNIQFETKLKEEYREEF